MTSYGLEKTAVVLIGYQNDYFADDGRLVGALEGDWRRTMLENTNRLLDRLQNTAAMIISTPIQFTPDYQELVEPTGILKTIVDVGAFRKGDPGSQTIEDLRRRDDWILEIPGKRGLNAFSNTELGATLEARGIKDVVLAGVVTSICIDSTGRAAAERGYRVSVLSDCTAGRTDYEQDFYCESIFPLYARVINLDDLCGATK
jgi:nicotinamidase-related amidase